MATSKAPVFRSTPDEIAVILAEHAKWLVDGGGQRANLSYANLSHATLSDANLSDATLSHANLSHANLSYADLSDANLSYATLSGANLSYANLSHATLSDANLSYANLSGANLSYAKGICASACTPLLMLLDQPGNIRAYKLVNEIDEGHINGGLKYIVGQSVSVDDANTDAAAACGAGINVATLDWCLREYRDGYRVLLVEFTAADIAAIPTGTDGKFRLHRCKVVGEKDVSQIVKAMRGKPVEAHDV